MNDVKNLLIIDTITRFYFRDDEPDYCERGK